MTFPLRIRPLFEGDKALVMSSLLRSRREWLARPNPETFDYEGFNASFAPVTLATVETNYVNVAVSPQDDEQILGWVAIHEHTLTFVYVKFTFRGSGIARALLASVRAELSTPIKCQYDGEAFYALQDRYNLELIR